MLSIESGAHDPLHRPKLLLVDDDEVSLMLIAVALRERGFDVAEASSGDRALQLLNERATDAVVLDAMMPGRDGFGDNLILRAGPQTGEPGILVLSHLDTVHPIGTLTNDLPVRVEGDRLYGPGVYDMKGGLVTLLFALRAHKEARTRAWDETTIAIVFNADEERLSPTSRPVIQEEAKRAHSVGILEPARAGGEYVMARKGAGTFELEVTGKASHAGLQPELGASAIYGGKIKGL